MGVLVKRGAAVLCFRPFIASRASMTNHDPSRLTRQERRRLARDAAKQSPQPTPTTGLLTGTKARQWPLALALVGLVFLAATLSLVKAGGQWASVGWGWASVGWAVTGAVGVAGFEGWRRFRQQFHFSRRWALLYVPGIFISGIVMAMVWGGLVMGMGEKARLERTLAHHQPLIDTVSRWTGGKLTDCTTARRLADTFQDDVLGQPKPATALELRAVVNAEQVLFQGGCDNGFPRLQRRLSNPPAGWLAEPTVTARLQATLPHVWPDNAIGCALERERAASLGQPLTTFDAACQMAQMSSGGWEMGRWQTLAQALAQKAQRTPPASTPDTTPVHTPSSPTP